MSTNVAADFRLGLGLPDFDFFLSLAPALSLSLSLSLVPPLYLDAHVPVGLFGSVAPPSLAPALYLDAHVPVGLFGSVAPPADVPSTSVPSLPSFAPVYLDAHVPVGLAYVRSIVNTHTHSQDPSNIQLERAPTIKQQNRSVP